MIMIAYLTISQKDSLEGQLIQPDWYFNPVQDNNGDWFITETQIVNSIYPQNEWVKDLELVPYNLESNQ